MEFTIAKREFLRGLTRAQGIAERKSSMPVLSNVLLTTEGSAIRVSATDLNVSVTTLHPAEIGLAGSITLGARTLFDIVRSLPDEQPIHVSVASTMSTELRCGRSRFRVVGLPGADFPTLPDGSAVDFTEIGADVIHGLIGKTYTSMSQDETRPHVAGALFEGDAKLLRMVTTDGHRLTKVEAKLAKGGLVNFSMLIPGKGVAELKKLVEEGDGTVAVGTAAGNVFFRRGPVLMSVKLTDAAFPPYEQVIPKTHERVVIAPRYELVEALRRVSLVSQDRALGVKLVLEPGKATVRSENPEVGDASEEVDVDYAGTAITFGFNARYMVDALDVIDDKEVRLELSKELDPCVIREATSDAFTAVVMPMRM